MTPIEGYYPPGTALGLMTITSTTQTAASPYLSAPSDSRFRASDIQADTQQDEFVASDAEASVEAEVSPESEPQPDPAAILAEENLKLFEGLKADLNATGPVGGSRSFRTKPNGDVVILNNKRTIIPQTGIKSVDRVSEELTPTVDTTTSVLGDIVSNTTQGAMNGAIVGAIAGVMRTLVPTVTSRKFGRMAAWTSSLAMLGATMGAVIQGFRPMVDGAKKLMQTFNGLLNDTLSSAKKERSNLKS